MKRAGNPPEDNVDSDPEYAEDLKNDAELGDDSRPEDDHTEVPMDEGDQPDPNLDNPAAPA